MNAPLGFGSNYEGQTLMAHPLEIQYGLTASELLDALNKRFRAKVTLEGAVAEVHLEKKIKALQSRGAISRYEEHDLDGYPDFTIWVPRIEIPFRLDFPDFLKRL
jgi:hypothetical protein